MQLAVATGHTVLDQNVVEVVVRSIAVCRFDATGCLLADDDDSLDAVVLEDQVEVRADERARSVLGDDQLARARFAAFAELCSPRSFDRESVDVGDQPLGADPRRRVALAIRQVDDPNVYQTDAQLARLLDEALGLCL